MVFSSALGASAASFGAHILAPRLLEGIRLSPVKIVYCYIAINQV